jgi:hypothetical protein
MAAGMFCSSMSLAGPGGHGPEDGPPPIPEAAYVACNGKAQGDAVSDDHATGTCQPAPNGKLALRPSGPHHCETPPSDSTFAD